MKPPKKKINIYFLRDPLDLCISVVVILSLSKDYHTCLPVGREKRRAQEKHRVYFG
jgi:hypothetical protein